MVLAARSGGQSATCTPTTDLWDRPGGATGEECFAIVQAKTAAKRAKESVVAAKKHARVQARKSKHASDNKLGSDTCEKLASEDDIKKLKVPELKAVLTYKGVAIDPKKSLKADLIELLTREMRGSFGSHVSPVDVAGTSEEVEPTAADFVDSSDDAASVCGSESSEWPHSEADDH